MRGLFLLFGSLFCLGTWPALLRLCTVELWLVYVIYASAYTFVSLLFNYGSDASISVASVLIAFCGGCLLSLGNLSLQLATVVHGAPLTMVLALQASLTVSLGTIFNYAIQPSMTSSVSLLVLGIICFLVAIGFATKAQVIHVVLKQAEQRQEYSTVVEDEEGEVAAVVSHSPHRAAVVSHTGLWVATAGGICFGFFSPAFNLSINNPWSETQATVETTNCWFAIGFWVASVVGNTIPSSRQRNPRSLPGRQRALAVFAGVICALGNLMQFRGGNLVGFAAADLVQAYPMISTIYDIILFREFKNASLFLWILLSAMYASYAMGIVLMASSVN